MVGVGRRLLVKSALAVGFGLAATPSRAEAERATKVASIIWSTRNGPGWRWGICAITSSAPAGRARRASPASSWVRR